MDPKRSDRTNRVEHIFQAAVDYPAAERVAYLDEVCNDDAQLRREVELMISSYERAGSFLDKPAIEVDAQVLASGAPKLSPGELVGSYKVVRLLGTGGMGEVYWAEDTKLRRKVALKLLPQLFTRDEQRVDRFQQEARAASTLNHPNILTIHDVGEADGYHYIATEFIEGETLRQVMSSRRLSLSEALDVAIQAVSGLTAAHQAGIVHRDIKPENVMIRPDGLVKLLDFGLAKLTEVRTSETLADASTLAKVETSPGVVMGTVSYMSPEQARGQLVDARTDIFSLGVVLYEMISGRVPFSGETASDVIAAILQNEPPQLARYEPEAPAELQWIVSKALRKDRDERYQTAKELLGDLRNLREGLQLQTKLDRSASSDTSIVRSEHRQIDRTGDVQTRPTSSEPRLIDRIRRHKSALAVTLVLSSVLIAVLGYVVSSINRGPQAEQRSILRKLERLTFSPGLQSEPTWSPDGRFIAYSSNHGGNFDIWVQPMGEGDPVQVTQSPAHDWQPDWSPDGSRIVFRSERDGGGLFIVSALGGNERKLSTFGYRPRWSPDGSQILFYGFPIFPRDPGTNAYSPAVYVVALDGRPPRQVLAGLTGEFYYSRVAWHPDGQRVSVWGNHHKSGLSFWTAPVSGGDFLKSEISVQVEKQLQEAGVDFDNFQWAPSGAAIYFEGVSQGVRNLWKVEVDRQTLRWIGGPERLTTGPGGDADMSVSRDGKRLALTTRAENTRIWSLAFNPLTGRLAGKNEPMTPAGIDVWQSNLSRDGKKLVYVAYKAERQELREKFLDNRREKLLVPDDGFTRGYPLWSRDGLRLIYQRYRPTNQERTKFESSLVMLSDGGGDEQMVTSTVPAFVYPLDWSADGEWILGGTDLVTPGHYFICKFPLRAAPEAEKQIQVLASEAEYRVFQPRFSPEERWISFNAYKAGEQTSAINVIATSGGQWIRITDGRYWDDKARWSYDGRTIYFVSNREGFFNVWGIRFDPRAGKPIDAPYRVTNFENPAQMVSPIMVRMEMSLGTDRILLPITEASGNIWVLENVDR